MEFEKKLRHLVTLIETSDISADDKLTFYALIKTSLDKVVLPILIKHLPEDKLLHLSANLNQVTTETYFGLLKEALVQKDFAKDLEKYTTEMLEVIESEMKKHGIIQ